jgi:hypothetical protein
MQEEIDLARNTFRESSETYLANEIYVAHMRITDVADVINNTRECVKCGLTKPFDEFYTRKDGLIYRRCKTCIKEDVIEHRHRAGINTPMAKAKQSPCYLGVYIAERVLCDIFENVTKMPYGNPGYDYLCGKGYKIDVKSACETKSEDRTIQRWGFHVLENQVPDYFLCLAFDNRENLEPQKLWLIPGNLINTKRRLSISKKSFPKWAKFELPIEKIECDKFRH